MAFGCASVDYTRAISLADTGGVDLHDAKGIMALAGKRRRLATTARDTTVSLASLAGIAQAP